MTRLAIVGAGGHGRVAADAAMLSGKWSEILFFDDIYPEAKLSSIWPIIGKVKELEAVASSIDGFVVAIGNAKVRQQLFEQFSQIATPVSIIHPSSVVSPRSHVGRGCVIFAGAVVNIGARLQDGVIVNTGATIDHDCHIGAFSHVCPGAHLAGDVAVGDRTWIGIGAVIKQGTSVGHDVTVGAGATVISDVMDSLTVVGTPAKVLQK